MTEGRPFPLHLPPYLTCPECGAELEYIGIPADYFRDHVVDCSGCARTLDVWDLVLACVRGDFYFWAFAAIGARTVVEMVELEPGGVTTVRLEALGIPADARVLMVNYTPQGPGVHPIELHGNNPRRRWAQGSVKLFGRPYPDSDAEQVQVAVHIEWCPRNDAEDPLELLVEAFELWHDSRPRSAVLFANAAVEARLTPIVAAALKATGVSNNSVESFVKENGHALRLKTMLPLLAARSEVPVLEEGIIGRLLSLNAWRNKVAHGLPGASALADAEVADMLTAAVFALSYFDHYGDLLGNAEGGDR